VAVQVRLESVKVRRVAVELDIVVAELVLYLSEAAALGDHFAAGLVALAMVCPFLLLLQQAVSYGLVLESELADELAELFDLVFHGLAAGVSQVDKELAEAVHETVVD